MCIGTLLAMEMSSHHYQTVENLMHYYHRLTPELNFFIVGPSFIHYDQYYCQYCFIFPFCPYRVKSTCLLPIQITWELLLTWVSLNKFPLVHSFLIVFGCYLHMKGLPLVLSVCLTHWFRNLKPSGWAQERILYGGKERWLLSSSFLLLISFTLV
jgi:hypothetical protein